MLGAAMFGKQPRFDVLQTAPSIQPSKELRRQEPEKKRSGASGCFWSRVSPETPDRQQQPAVAMVIPPRLT